MDLKIREYPYMQNVKLPVCNINPYCSMFNICSMNGYLRSSQLGNFRQTLLGPASWKVSLLAALLSIEIALLHISIYKIKQKQFFSCLSEVNYSEL